MSFQTYEFILFFIAVSFAYYLIPRRVRVFFLVAVSWYFYSCWGVSHLIWLIASTAVSWLFGLGISAAVGQGRKKALLIIGICLHLGLLCFFKYTDFALQTLQQLKILGPLPSLPVFSLAAPAGISFYTFAVVGYLIDVYRGKAAERNILRYALFVSFFPKLAQGPIERADYFLPQIDELPVLRWDNVTEGLIQMLYGFFQKMVIADNLAVSVNEVYGFIPKYNSVELIIATIFFAVQIYCDFAGYTNIALGAARVMGFRLTENFNAPYLAVSVPDFWRRWHMSLTGWFRDYLYIPLGGNRRGRLRKYFNIMFVFLVSGLWHGASWHFVAWGGINGLYQVIGDLLKPLRNAFWKATGTNKDSFSHRLGSRIITFVLICFAWIFFRANTIGDALLIIQRIFTCPDPWFFVNQGIYEIGLGKRMMRMVSLAIPVAFAVDILHNSGENALVRLKKQGYWLRCLVLLVLLLWVLTCGSYGTGFEASAFLYTQF